ncbi:MAG: methyl-accepting chemotaxis protein [Candidatus Omnitrophica bacterium]|nr:methyl-accepting chemotaxis protein [Candidatus Omnitrophota bacterium]
MKEKNTFFSFKNKITIGAGAVILICLGVNILSSSLLSQKKDAIQNRFLLDSYIAVLNNERGRALKSSGKSFRAITWSENIISSIEKRDKESIEMLVGGVFLTIENQIKATKLAVFDNNQNLLFYSENDTQEKLSEKVLASAASLKNLLSLARQTEVAQYDVLNIDSVLIYTMVDLIYNDDDELVGYAVIAQHPQQNIEKASAALGNIIAVRRQDVKDKFYFSSKPEVTGLIPIDVMNKSMKSDFFMAKINSDVYKIFVARQPDKNNELAAEVWYMNNFTLQAKKMSQLTSVNYGVLIGVIMIGIGALFLIIRNLLEPLIRIKNALHDIAQGEGDLTKRITFDNFDEIGQVAHWFNIFVEKIEGTIIQIRASSKQLLSATGEISSSSQQIADGAQKQSASFEELSSSIQSTAENTKNANERATNATAMIKETENAMNNTLETMTSIEKSSSQITDAVNLISDIADQTNLLALNAAIEAARAGEHGKGFAVVADEVRLLAEKSAASAKDIEQLMKESNKQVGKGVAVSSKAGEILEVIIDSIKQVATQLQDITDATQEQSNAMQENTSITESNAAGAEELAAASEQMAAQSEALKKVVDQFKVNDK